MKSRILFWNVIALIFLEGTTVTFAQWNEIPALKNTTVYCLLTTNDSTVFIGGDMGFLYRSNDNGTTWKSVWSGYDTILALGKRGRDIFAGTNGMHGVYRSSDSGNTWSAANSGLPSITRVNAFTYADSTLYAATNYGVYTSKDNGGTWKIDTAGLHLGQIYPGVVGGTVGMTSTRTNVYVILEGWPRGVYTSSLDSTSWKFIGLDTVWGYAMAAIDTNVFAATPEGVFLYSGLGTTWLPRSNGLPSPMPYAILTSVDSLLFVYARQGFQDNRIFVSSNLGKTWTKISGNTFANSPLRAMSATNTFLIAGTDRGAWRLRLADLLVSVNNDDPHMPSEFALSQNYPNPFNPTTTIQFSIPARPAGGSKLAIAKLQIVDLLGREVAVLMNEEKPSGTYTVTWDASGLPSGVYFYRLAADGHSKTRKLLLLR